jgi:hypothetical protein
MWATGRHIAPFEAVLDQPVKLVMTPAPPPPPKTRRRTVTRAAAHRR